jgi:hypothetical protein
MKESSFKRFRIVALAVSLFGAMIAAGLLPAYGQQEVDPTWHDPWAADHVVLAHHPPKAQASIHRHQGIVRFGTSHTGKARATAHDPANVATKATHTRADLRSLTAQARR